MKYQVNLPNKAYECEIDVEIVGSQLQATETVRKGGKRVSSNGYEVDFASPEEALAAGATVTAGRWTLKAISKL